jgi:uncharacterized protein (DUF952 family)
MRIFHIAYECDWVAAIASGEYAVSTKGRTLDEEGFVHASFSREQVERVGNYVYGSDEGALVVLVIDTDVLEVPVVGENLDGRDELFPHIYGAVPSYAVVATIPARAIDSTFTADWEHEVPVVHAASDRTEPPER